MANIDFEHTPPATSLPNYMKNLLLYAVAGIFNLASNVTADSVYTWTFRFLSLVSIGLIISLNFFRLKEYFKKP